MTDIDYNSPKKMIKKTNNGLQDTTHTQLRLSNKYATKVWDDLQWLQQTEYTRDKYIPVDSHLLQP
jgi:hypothetical protein